MSDTMVVFPLITPASRVAAAAPRRFWLRSRLAAPSGTLKASHSSAQRLLAAQPSKALPIACMPWSWILLPLRLRGCQLRSVEDGQKSGVSRGADTKANALGAGGALELLEHAILLDAARDDDGGRDAEPLHREVDLLGRLRALELVEVKRVAIDSARDDAPHVTRGAKKERLLWQRGT